jgi:hypothetical protein
MGKAFDMGQLVEWKRFLSMGDEVYEPQEVI